MIYTQTMDESIPLQLPSWLTDNREVCDRTRISKTQIEVQEAIFESIFEELCEHYTRTSSVKELIESDPRNLSFRVFMKWLNKKENVAKKMEFEDAARYGAFGEEERLMKIAMGTAKDENGNLMINDVARDKLIIDTIKYKQSINDKDRYDRDKNINIKQTTTFNIRNILESREDKMREYLLNDPNVIDVTPKLTNDDD